MTVVGRKGRVGKDTVYIHVREANLCVHVHVHVNVHTCTCCNP